MALFNPKNPYAAPTYEQQLGGLTPEYDMSGNPTGRYIGYNNLDGSATYYDAGSVKQTDQGYTQTVSSYETPQEKLYRQVAGGEVTLTPDQFNTLFSNEDRALSEGEFDLFSPETQAWAKQNPQLFMQSILANRNEANADLGSIGAEGGYSNLGAVTPTATGLDYSKAGYMDVNEEPDWGLYAALAIMGGAAYAGAAGMATGGSTAAGVGAGEAAATGAAAGSFVPSAATGGMLGLGAPASTALGLGYGGVGTLGAGMTSAELAALGAGGIGAGTAAMGALAGTGGGIMTAAGGAAFDAAMASGAGYDAAMQAAMAAGGDVGAGGGWLSTAKDAYDMYSTANKAKGAYSMLTGGGTTPSVGGGTGGGMATGTDWGSMFGNLVGGAGSALSAEALGNQSLDYAKQMADKVKFTPYAISSDIGRTYQDPATGEMISKLDPRFAAQQQAMLGAVGTNLAASQADPQLAAQDAYSKMRMLSAFPEEQQRLAMENRLLQQGMLGSTGGANQTRAMQEAMNTNNVNQQLQSIGLGQTLANNAMTRAGQVWSGAMAPTTSMQNQLNQTGQFGSNAMQGQFAGANLMNNAFLNLQDSRAKTAQGLFGSPTFSSYGQQQPGTTVPGITGQQTSPSGLINQGVNWGVNQIGNWLGGNATQPAYGVDQYNSLLGQQEGFNWSGVGGISAGSAQDMMLNDQWDWSW